MFAVVVLQVDPHVHCVVPEEYIFGISEIEAEMKTWGVHKQHNHLIFWSHDLVNAHSNVVFNPPNFNLPLSTEFPPNNSACFRGRIKRFFQSFENAKEYCERFRPVDPVTYNQARLLEQPIPDENDDAQSENEYGEIVHVNVRHGTDEHFEQPIPEENDDAHFEIEHFNVEHFENEHDFDENNIEIGEVKFEMPIFHMDDNDNHALDMLLNEENDADTETFDHADDSCVNEIDCGNVNVALPNSVPDGMNNEKSNSIQVSGNGSINIVGAVSLNPILIDIHALNISPNEINDAGQATVGQLDRSDANKDISGNANEDMNNEQLNTVRLNPSTSNEGNEKVTVNEKGQVEVTKILDDDMEIRYIRGQKLLAILHPYETKSHDVMSGNLPFKESKEKDRCYLVKVGDIFEKVKINGRLVAFLTKLNTERASDVKADKIFIKAALIGVFSVKVIKAGPLEPALIAFVKDLFAVRTQSRLSSFESLVAKACDEILNNV